jgi:hypothetical protein
MPKANDTNEMSAFVFMEEFKFQQIGGDISGSKENIF